VSSVRPPVCAKLTAGAEKVFSSLSRRGSVSDELCVQHACQRAWDGARPGLKCSQSTGWQGLLFVPCCLFHLGRTRPCRAVLLTGLTTVAAWLPSDQGRRAENVSSCCIPGGFPGSLKGWQGYGFFFEIRGVGVRSDSLVGLCACSTQKALWAERTSETVSGKVSSFCCLFWLSSWGGGWSGVGSERGAGLGSWT
jgi:hypothetical protein